MKLILRISILKTDIFLTKVPKHLININDFSNHFLIKHAELH